MTNDFKIEKADPSLRLSKEEYAQKKKAEKESRIYLPLSIAFLFHSGTFFSSSYIAR